MKPTIKDELLDELAASGIGPLDPKVKRRTPPQIQTSAMNASGSSSYGFAPKAVHHLL